MHTLNFEDYRFHYNPDMSGDVIVAGDGPNRAIYIPIRILLAFIAEIVRNEKIERMKNAATPQEIFGLSTNSPRNIFDQELPKLL